MASSAPVASEPCSSRRPLRWCGGALSPVSSMPSFARPRPRPTQAPSWRAFELRGGDTGTGEMHRGDVQRGVPAGWSPSRRASPPNPGSRARVAPRAFRVSRIEPRRKIAFNPDSRSAASADALDRVGAVERLDQVGRVLEADRHARPSVMPTFIRSPLSMSRASSPHGHVMIDSTAPTFAQRPRALHRVQACGPRRCSFTSNQSMPPWWPFLCCASASAFCGNARGPDRHVSTFGCASRNSAIACASTPAACARPSSCTSAAS